MVFPTPLNTDAESQRKNLAKWAGNSVRGQDYVVDEKGNRIYYREKIARYVDPLLTAMGLSGWGYTMWRYSAYTPIDPVPRAEIYFIPIDITTGQPQIIQDGRQSQVVPGWFTVTLGAFELTPEFDCLLIGDISKIESV
ncbi:hypothetical protein BDV24DRAFT_5048 [Aspergillus arachidicola]|uniref:Uncharacterized protein n=1 Tax=Aspergillus arachidicola TaxID=656916 RepID=A0A5N6XRA9_9EURO|nr:hypothetical protein BDV24DRAFT_5048 [Aspergillus arachidicola]